MMSIFDKTRKAEEQHNSPSPEWKTNLPTPLNTEDTGRLITVTVRGERKTFVGIYLGEVYTRAQVVADFLQPNTKETLVYVPDLNRTYLGSMVWWSFIHNREEAAKVTQKDTFWFSRAVSLLNNEEEQ